MALYTEDRAMAIVDAYNGIGEALGKLETALAAVDVEEYRKPGQDFIRDMAWLHRRLKETHVTYQSDVAEVDAAIWRDMAEDGFIRGAE